MRYPILILLLSFFSSLSYATSCPSLDGQFRNDDNLTAKLGYGKDWNREISKQQSCLSFTPQFINGGSSELKLNVISSFEDVLNKTKIEFGGKVSYMAIFKVGLQQTYEKIIHEKAFNQSFLLSYDIDFGTYDAQLDDNAPLNNTGKQLSDDGCEFKRVCGNAYVCQAHSSAGIDVKIDFAFTSSYHKRLFKTKVSAEISTGKFGGGLSAAVEKLSETTRKNSSVQIEAIQKGGNIEDLSSILGGGTIFNCGLDNLKACDEALTKISEYVASEKFRVSARANPSISKHKYCSYSNILGVPSIPSEITPEIEAAREQLVNAYKKLLADKRKAFVLLELSLSDERIQKLEDLLVILDKDTDAVYSAGQLCLNNLAQCSNEATKVLEETLAYDENILEPQLSDGLMGGYSFDGNTHDVSGNDNHGVNFGATLTEDRNGVPNNAYKFNGLNSYIELPNKQSLNITGDLTLVAWIHPDSFANSNGTYVIWGYDSYTFQFVPATQLLANYRYGVSNPGYHRTSNNSVLVGKNTLIASVWNGDSLKQYVNGKLNNTVLNVGGTANHTRNTYIGVHRLSNGNSTFHGTIDNVRIYNRTLSDEEIKKIHTLTKNEFNHLPFAVFSVSQSQQSFSVDASYASDTDGTIAQYQWHTSDGQTSDGQTAQFNFQKSGEHLITLTVTDDKGATSQAQKKVYVTSSVPPPPPNCKAQYSLDGRLYLPCVQISVLGSSQILEVTLNQLKPNLKFKVDPLNLPQHNFRDACLATYTPSTGKLSLPCVTVQGVSREYAVELQQQSGTLTFSVTQLHY